MIIEIKVMKDMVVRTDVHVDTVLDIENHVANVNGYKSARKVGDVEAMDCIATVYDEEKEAARAASRSLWKQVSGTKDKRERLALKKVAMKGLRSV